MSYTKRDSKDPMPTAANTERNGGGNEVTSGEKHDQGKSEKVTASQNRTTGPTAKAVAQPTRQSGDGNMPATGESHDQGKSSTIPASRRW